jgi:hypothetical protein
VSSVPTSTDNQKQEGPEFEGVEPFRDGIDIPSNWRYSAAHALADAAREGEEDEDILRPRRLYALQLVMDLRVKTYEELAAKLVSNLL